MERGSLKKILEKKPCDAIERYRFEKDLSERYGLEGIKVYLFIDGRTAADEVMGKAGLQEERFIELVTFMEGKGMLKPGEQTTVLTAVAAKPESQPLPKAGEVSPIPLIKTEGVVESKGSVLETLIAKEIPQEKIGEVKPEEQPKPPEKEQPPPESEKLLRVPKTPLEKKLYEKFGDAGLSVYSLIDESKTPRDILAQTKISEAELVNILDFMNTEGIIKLEAPRESMWKPIIKAPSPAEAAPVALKPTKPAEVPQPQKRLEKPMPKPAPVEFNREELYIPTVSTMSLLTKLRVEAELFKKYGNDGIKSFSLMNGKRTTVKIIKDTKINPSKLDDLLSFLLERGLLKLQPIAPDNLKEMYGEEGSVIYGKYKRDGILLYELIDKKAALKDIVKASGIEPKRAVEMFSFIHKVLGLEVPLDTEILYRQLGIKP